MEHTRAAAGIFLKGLRLRTDADFSVGCAGCVGSELDPAQVLSLVSEPVMYGVYDKVPNAEKKEKQQEVVEPLNLDLDDERLEEQDITPDPTDPTQPILAADLEGVHDKNSTLHTLHILHDSTLKVGDKVEYIGTDESLGKAKKRLILS